MQKAEHLGLDFALSMVKHRGFGGDTEFWDYNLESFTLMAGIAAVTERIKLVASTAILTLPPAVVARMARTVDSIAPGRVGVNIVTGWAPNEYTQMGIWPGNEYFGYRYDDASEYCEVMRQLWAEGSSDFKGEHFQMEDCMMKPVPENKIEIVAAGQPERGMRFSAEYADYSFVMGRGINTPTDFAPVCAELVAAAEKTGSRCRGLCPVHGDRGRDRREGPGQVEPVSRRRRHEGAVLHGRAGGAGFSGQRPVHRKAINLPEGAVNFNMGTIVGSCESCARMLDEATRSLADDPRPLAGIPVALKDMIDTADMPTTHNSRCFPATAPPPMPPVTSCCAPPGSLSWARRARPSSPLPGATRRRATRMTRRARRADPRPVSRLWGGRRGTRCSTRHGRRCICRF